MIRLSFPLVGSVVPDSLCGGAKWSRQKVGSWHAAEVVGPAGETGQDPEKNKHGAETRQGAQINADEVRQ